MVNLEAEFFQVMVNPEAEFSVAAPKAVAPKAVAPKPASPKLRIPDEETLPYVRRSGSYPYP